MSHRKRHTEKIDIVDLPNTQEELLDLLADAESARAQIERRLAHVTGQRVAIKEKLKLVHASKARTSVSDHAVVRYLERTKGIDVESIREEILGYVPEGISASWCAELINIDTLGVALVVRDRHVVTVKPIRGEVIDEAIDA